MTENWEMLSSKNVYRSDPWVSGQLDFLPNDWYGYKGQVSGTIHFFHATDLEFVSPPVSGDLEDIETLVKPANELFEAIRSGEIPILAATTGLMLMLSGKKRLLSTPTPQRHLRQRMPGIVGFARKVARTNPNRLETRIPAIQLFGSSAPSSSDAR